MRKKNLHTPKGNAGAIQYPKDIHGYETLFLAQHKKFSSWRKVAEPYEVHPSMARMIANGYDPGNRIREKLRLPNKQAVEVCPSCGIAHTTKRCTSTNGSKPRPPRIAIRTDNPDSAAASIKGHMDQEKVSELIELLQEDRYG